MEDNLKTERQDEDKKAASDEGKTQNKAPEMEQNAENEGKYTDFYLRLRKKIDQQLKNQSNANTPLNTLFNLLVLLPDLFYLCAQLILDRKVAPDKKGALLGAILYVVSPIDLIPDLIPTVGWLDDLIVITVGLNSLLETKDDAHLTAAIEKYWAGERSIYDTLRHIIAVTNSAVEFLPKKLMNIIKDLLKKK
jgi:uncharacterized membrane protein YkvA (DUF1232 family)